MEDEVKHVNSIKRAGLLSLLKGRNFNTFDGIYGKAKNLINYIFLDSPFYFV